jgi:pyruvate,water dikinase
MPELLIQDLNQNRISKKIGRKAENLQFLIRAKCPVPETLICTWDAYLRHLAGDTRVVQQLRAELRETLVADRSYAVRSSANIEDGQAHSFAGQFRTELNVKGVDSVLEGIQAVWASARSPKVKPYIDKTTAAPGGLKMAVIIQKMVTPAVSGVSFSKNPITGLDEIIVEAVSGSGETLVQDGMTPYRWVHKWGAWAEAPKKTEIAVDLIQDVVNQTKAIAKIYGRPVDLEWVFDGRSVHWVQLREITALDIPLYSNRISREVFPGVIKPLVWSVNVPLVNGAWVKFLTELIGPNEIKPESLAKSFYYRAYFNMRTLGDILETLGLPRETLELLIGIESEGEEKPSFKPTRRTYRLLPRILAMILDKLRFGQQIEAFLPRMETQLKAIHPERADRLNENELLEVTSKLYSLVQETAYYNIVTPLLLMTYNRILQGQLERIGLSIDQVDVTAGLEELERLEPHTHLAQLHRGYSALDEKVQKRIREGSYGEFSELSGIEALQEEVRRFIERFGHLSDNGNDFSSVPWRETPELVLEMMVGFQLAVDGANHRRRFEELEMPLLRGALLRPLYRRARTFRWYREAVSSLYTYGYGLFRYFYLALGKHFVVAGFLAAPDDVFYLTHGEVRQIVARRPLENEAQRTVQERKMEIERVLDITPPDIVFGEDIPPVQTPADTYLKGIPTSRGQHTGPAKVIRRLSDFSKLNDRDVLVVPYSDIGWAPLFAKAGAIVAEAGGILSHSSIVAREFGIPAVVSVPGACQIADGTIVTVDGFQGHVAVCQTSHRK